MPSALKMEAYSLPITPPPTTIIDLGSRVICRTVSLSKMLSRLNGMNGGRAGDMAQGEEV